MFLKKNYQGLPIMLDFWIFIILISPQIYHVDKKMVYIYKKRPSLLGILYKRLANT